MDNIYLLSYDCAHKSLGVSFFSYNNNYKTNIKDELKRDILPKPKLININNILNNVISLKYLDVIDVCPGENVKTIDKIRLTNLFKKEIIKINNIISKFIIEYNIKKIILCIEYQPTYNYLSVSIFHQLKYEYSNNDLYEISIMYPHVKNTIFFHPLLKHNNCIATSNSGYLANKKHTKLNMLYFINNFNLQNKIIHIKKKNLDDLADSIFQAIAYIKYIKNK